MGIRDRIAALLGISTFAQPAERHRLLSLDDPSVVAVREAHGGQLAPISRSRIRWYLKDLERAERETDFGRLAIAAQLMRSARKDGVYSGVLSTRTNGLVRLPKRFRGNSDIVAALEKGHEETRSVFDELCPSAELALLQADGLELGVAVGELVEVEGRDHGRLVRLDPEFLYYIWSENQWYYRTIAGVIAVTPGDGRWVLHVPGGRVSPWHHGLWRAVGRAYIRKEHASFYRDNWNGKLANAARVATAPQGASEPHKEDWFNAVAAWGANTVFGITPGYEVQLLESNGRGHESFQVTIADQNEELIIAVAGQTVTTDGGVGFANADIHKSVRADLISGDAESLAHTINTQILPSWIVERFGEDALSDPATVEWDVEPAKDRNAEALALQTASIAIKTMTEALEAHNMTLDVKELAIRFGIPLSDDKERAPDVTLTQALDLATAQGQKPTLATVINIADRFGVKLEEIGDKDVQPVDLDLAPTDLAKVVKAGEARRSKGLPLFGDERDELTITQMGESAEARAETEGDKEVIEAQADADEALQDDSDDSETESTEDSATVSADGEL